MYRQALDCPAPLPSKVQLKTLRSTEHLVVLFSSVRGTCTSGEGQPRISQPVFFEVFSRASEESPPVPSAPNMAGAQSWMFSSSFFLGGGGVGGGGVQV